ncbi:hypothetical protein AXG93_4448s1340 [Marchantia polymorpha subsp. ruderalis]|uniref:Uncharacterized protein n=1 Tax=Marchantia polymorpha subsp. ruderalis TaxID=1480154 RepID=A0A176VCR7_MARPO|nr:hypothetical protein AXG93_4448s1340 [Marchantia polymorpha subsp. ruderalis]
MEGRIASKVQRVPRCWRSRSRSGVTRSRRDPIGARSVFMGTFCSGDSEAVGRITRGVPPFMSTGKASERVSGCRAIERAIDRSIDRLYGANNTCDCTEGGDGLHHRVSKSEALRFRRPRRAGAQMLAAMRDVDEARGRGRKEASVALLWSREQVSNGGQSEVQSDRGGGGGGGGGVSMAEGRLACLRRAGGVSMAELSSLWPLPSFLPSFLPSRIPEASDAMDVEGSRILSSSKKDERIVLQPPSSLSIDRWKARWRRTWLAGVVHASPRAFLLLGSGWEEWREAFVRGKRFGSSGVT